MSNLRVSPIILFMAFLLLPLTAKITGFPQVEPLKEYRTLAERPHVSVFFKQTDADFLEYTKQLNAWYSDQFATRPFWVRLYTQTLYSLFRESDQVYVGRNGWLYYHSVIDTETPPLENISAAERAAMVSRYGRLSELLKQRGITLFVMPLALKHRYYPEFIPSAAEHAKHFKFYDSFLDELKADGRIRLIDGRKALEQAKADGLKIYHQTDFHWTDPAGALVMRQLLSEIAKGENNEELLRSWTYEVLPDPGISGGQARALPLFHAPTENSLKLEFKAPQTAFAYKFKEGGIEWSGIAEPGQQKLFDPIFVYGDSYFDAGSRAGFFNFFSSFARARQWQDDMTEAYKNRQPGTRYMVVEFISSATFGMDNYIKALIFALESDPKL